MKLRVLVCLIGFILSASTAQARSELVALARSTASRLPLTPCTLDGIQEELLCGTLDVYENRTTQSGRKIALNVIVVPSLLTDPTDDPLFYFEGGPGVPATDMAGMFVEDSSFRRTRDIVLVDIRGTGKSNPLHCDLLGDPLDLQNYLNDMYPDSLVIACRKQLDQVADLSQYTTPIVVEDLEDVRRWLGYDKIHILGLSYGTRLALTYMRLHPSRIRSAVLIGPLAPSVRLPSRHAEAAQRALELVLEDCESDSACRLAFPNLRGDLETLSLSLATTGADVVVKHPISGEKVTLHIRKEIFFERLRSKMYVITGARELPWIIVRAAQGDFDPFLELVIPEDFYVPPWMAEGLYLSITGAEDIPYIDTVRVRRSYEDTYFGNYRVVQQTNAARHWPCGALPAGYHDSFTSDVPSLIVSGVRDPITPPSFANEVASLLPNGTVIRVPSMAHVPAGMSHPECLMELIYRFIDAGSANSLDTACVERMQAPPFKISSD